MKRQTPNPLRDGTLQVCELTDVSLPGEIPVKALRTVWNLRYDERIVGMARFWTAKQATATIDLLVRCHQIRAVTTHHIVILRDGEQYNIKQIQYPPDVAPAVMDLSLERRADKYAVEEVANG